MDSKFKTSILFSTYNQPDYLILTLNSIFAQSVLPDEIVIADDGSRDETRELIDAIREVSPVPIMHVWHEDDGFRKSAIMNKAVSIASGDYIIQIDGDIVLHRHFVKDHISAAKPHTFSAGSRVLLPETLSKRMLDGQDIRIPAKVRLSTMNAYRIPCLMKYMAGRYKQTNRRSLGRGCNFAFWKEDFVKVNGYNEDMVGWGFEDSELAIRMLNAGTGKQILKLGAVCYHVWHKLNSRHNETRNWDIYQAADVKKIKYTENGISKYL